MTPMQDGNVERKETVMTRVVVYCVVTCFVVLFGLAIWVAPLLLTGDPAALPAPVALSE
jgi:hypothetical protein